MREDNDVLSKVILLIQAGAFIGLITPLRRVFLAMKWLLLAGSVLRRVLTHLSSTTAIENGY
jgi:hypothetical protein